MNYEIRKFQTDLINLVNGAQIPIEAKRLVMESVFNQVVITSERIINDEIKASQKEDKDDGIPENNMD